MGEIINLRRARKRTRDAEAERTAAGNRARFGRTRAQKAAEAAETTRAARVLDGAHLDQDGVANLAKDRTTTS